MEARTFYASDVRLVMSAVEEARATLGSGWAHVSDEIRTGLVGSYVLAKLASRVDTDSTEAEASRVGFATDRCWQLVLAVRSYGWRAPLAEQVSKRDPGAR